MRRQWRRNASARSGRTKGAGRRAGFERCSLPGEALGSFVRCDRLIHVDSCGCWVRSVFRATLGSFGLRATLGSFDLRATLGSFDLRATWVRSEARHGSVRSSDAGRAVTQPSSLADRRNKYKVDAAAARRPLAADVLCLARAGPRRRVRRRSGTRRERRHPTAGQGTCAERWTAPRSTPVLRSAQLISLISTSRRLPSAVNAASSWSRRDACRRSKRRSTCGAFQPSRRASTALRSLRSRIVR
jgi:hypothetical protein